MLLLGGLLDCWLLTRNELTFAEVLQALLRRSDPEVEEGGEEFVNFPSALPNDLIEMSN
jgi:hypothetical protein